MKTSVVTKGTHMYSAWAGSLSWQRKIKYCIVLCSLRIRSENFICSKSALHQHNAHHNYRRFSHLSLHNYRRSPDKFLTGYYMVVWYYTTKYIYIELKLVRASLESKTYFWSFMGLLTIIITLFHHCTIELRIKRNIYLIRTCIFYETALSRHLHTLFGC